MKIFIYYLAVLMFFSLSCESENSSSDITAYDWKLISIKSGDETIIISQKSYVKEGAYILKFLNDSTFFLNTSVNSAMGNYNILGDEIKVPKYQELTEVATNDPEQIQINDLLLQHLGNVTKYSINQEELIFYSNNVEFIFKNE